MRHPKAAFVVPALLTALSASAAEMRLPKIFGDHMVVQRGVPLPVFGWATPGEKVAVNLAGQVASAVADKEFPKKNIVCSGPLYKAMQAEGGAIRIAFDHVGSGLMVGKKEGTTPTAEVKGGKLQRFAIAGKDKQWAWAEAKIDGKTVVVWSEKVPQPVAVRYAYSMNPQGANLYNKEGLPASPFRTDDW